MFYLWEEPNISEDSLRNEKTSNDIGSYPGEGKGV